MTLIYIFLGFIVGTVLIPFTFIPVLIILVFGMPFTKKLEKLGLLKSPNPIIRNESISLVLLSAIFALITTLAYVVFPQVAIGYTISLVFTLFNGLGQVGVNKNNVTDYLQTNSQYLLKSQEEVLQLI